MSRHDRRSQRVPRRDHRGRTTALVLLAALALGACSRPSEPLQVGMREVASDIVLGLQGDGLPPVIVPPPPLPPTAVVISVPVAPPTRPAPRFQPTPNPTATPTTGPTAPVDACPEDHPLEAPRFDAPHELAQPPVEQQLTYRNEGTFSTSGANANEGTFGGDTIREIVDVVVSDNGDFTYGVRAELGGTTTTTTYRVINEPPVGDPGGVFGQGNVRDGRGLFLVSVRTEGPDGATDTFQPQPSLLLLPFPNSSGDALDERGVDPISGTVMEYTGTVGETQRSNACGEPVHGIEVTLTGQIQGPGTDVDFTATYRFATQYGGLSVEDTFTTAGTEGGVTSARSNHATVNQVPVHDSERS